MELRIDNVTKVYGKKAAVVDFSTMMYSGVYGILGANGAGKTTLLRMIAELLRPTRGRITFEGESIYTMGETYRNLIGYLPQDFGFYPEFTAEDFLHYLAAAKGLSRTSAKDRTKELLELVNLNDYTKQKIKTFSGGMLKRLGIAQALLNDPLILILDEPTAGLDPKERIRFRNLISKISTNKIVLLSTHIVSDVESIANEILLIKDGHLIKQGNTEDVASLAQGKVWTIRVQPSELGIFEEKYNLANVKVEDGDIELRVISEASPAASAVPTTPTLEDAYLYIFGGEKE